MQRNVLHSTPTRHLVDDGEGAVGPVPQQEVIASRQNPSGAGATVADDDCDGFAGGWTT